jgi:hypothetical protein
MAIFWLAIFKDDWADEMDVEGCAIMTDEVRRLWEERVRKLEDEFVVGLGTNQDITYSDGDDLLTNVSFTQLTEAEAKAYAPLVGTVRAGTGKVFATFGHFPLDREDSSEDLEYCDEDEDDD